MIKISGLEHLTATMQPEVLGRLLEVFDRRLEAPDGCSVNMKYSKTPSQVLDVCRIRLRRARGLVRPGAAGLLIGIECSRVRDSVWMYLISFCNYPNMRRTSCSTRKLPGLVVVELQQYSVRTFHVTLSPSGVYKGGQGPPPNNHLHLRQYKPPHRT